tara:strand:- start:8673 stop:9005 length:333 start_codon:yes stop_codon:yes gene_type:complete
MASVLREYANWIEKIPTNGQDFCDWREEYHDDFMRRCDDISKNIYIMSESVNAFKRYLRIGDSFKRLMENPLLLQAIDEICESVGVCSEEYFSLAGQAYENRCLAVFQSN